LDISKEQYKSLNNKYIKCICPNCGNVHKKKMIWVGRGKPRKFCPTCQDISRRVGELNINTIPQFNRKPHKSKDD
jgi:hypothetical protein